MKTGIKGRYCCVVCFYLKKNKKAFSFPQFDHCGFHIQILCAVAAQVGPKWSVFPSIQGHPSLGEQTWI